MPETEIRLLLSFSTISGKKVSLYVADPREDLTEVEIKTAMDAIITKNIFAPGGVDLDKAIEAKIVETSTTEYDLVVA